MPNPENIKNTTFRDRPENINKRGAPPKVLTQVLRELTAAGYERVNAALVMEAYEVLLGLDEDMIKHVVADKMQVMSLRIVGRAMLSTRGAEMLEKMLDRAHGKPKQQTDLNLNLDGTGITAAIAPKEAIKKLNEILNSDSEESSG